MKITVFGCGYVGLTTAVGLADLGHKVIGIDRDLKKVAQLQKGQVPFFEPKLKALLQKQLRLKAITFSADAQFGITESEIVICAVGTANYAKAQTDLSAVFEVAKSFVRFKKDEKIFINKSTVTVGGNEKIQKIIAPAKLIYNPEFLREGSALKDFFKPDRIIIGLKNTDLKLQNLIRKIYQPILKKNVPLLTADFRSAEMIKYAANAFLATRISFINEIANFCETAGADIELVRRGIGLDKRIGTVFLQPGIGFGGSCLPKDLKNLIAIGKKNNFNFGLLKQVELTNQQQPYRVIKRLKSVFKSLKGKAIAILGLSFKANTDDIREAPSLKIIQELLREGANVRVFDPAAMPKVKLLFGNKLHYGKTCYSISAQADALLILTDWDQFKKIDLQKLRRLMRYPLILSPALKLKSRRSRVRFGL